MYEVLSASKLLCYAATSKLPRAMAVNLTEPVCMKNEIFKESSSQAVWFQINGRAVVSILVVIFLIIIA